MRMSGLADPGGLSVSCRGEATCLWTVSLHIECNGPIALHGNVTNVI